MCACVRARARMQFLAECGHRCVVALAQRRQHSRAGRCCERRRGGGAAVRFSLPSLQGWAVKDSSVRTRELLHAHTICAVLECVRARARSGLELLW